MGRSKGRSTASRLEIVSDRPLTINSQTFCAGVVIDVEGWRGRQLIANGTAWHAALKILYEIPARKQDDAAFGKQGVTCVCLTRNRRDWLPKAIACYQAQSYQHRELLIVADGEDVQDLVPQDDESIRLIHIEEAKPPYTIGAKRNFGCEHAEAPIVIHWDDDDYSAPRRIEEQVALLHSSGKAVVGFNAMVFTDGVERWRYSGTRNYALGTSLCYRKEWWRAHPFRAIQVGEDGEFVKVAQHQNQIASVDAGELMTATNHPGNTSPRNLVGSEWTKLA